MVAMPPVRVAKEMGAWIVSVTAYTVSGAVASSIVGAAIGGAGAYGVRSDFAGPLAVPICLAVCAAVVLREARLIQIPLPQWKRQTSAIWAYTLPAPAAATLWGIDLGLIFTTWLTYAGPWLLATIAFVAGDVVFAAALFVAYWFGRVLTVWLVPVLGGLGIESERLVDQAAADRGLFRKIHVAGALWAGGVLLVMLIGVG